MHIHAKSKRLNTVATLLTAMVICITTCGCNYLMVFGYLLGGPPSVEPLFDKETKESMTDKGVKVVVVCFAPDDIKYNFESIDYELAQYVAFQLHSHKISVISPDLSKAWLEEHKDWDKPEEIGAYFKTNYVVYIDLNEFSLFEEGSTDLYRGKSEAIVSVYKMDDDEHGEKIFSAEKTSKYPLHQPVSSSDKTYNTFKGEYLTRLSDEIGRFFYEYYVADEIASGGG
ncbi:hypothetical protein [Schlesneria paludicola]|uniref:hypothetical protein n=1 Tax=Schlesneria paludicola TaxID=360056 RepID=UPI0003177312|nr:hypothetical protein [Schlesneria paludicola]